MKNIHEIRDPIHTFIRISSNERAIIDSPAFQRLRNIHQLALTYLVYPGATHKRFEHSLGTMELATRIFDVITEDGNIHDAIRRRLPEISDRDKRGYWRGVLRAAALCHDIGHLPFSHAAEHQLLPAGWTHERIGVEVLHRHIEPLLDGQAPHLRIGDVIKVAVGPKFVEQPLTDWELIMSEIVSGNAFGADRMDYLLRDSLHAGVAYGRFDHYRLIDSLRILPRPYTESPALGVDVGGLNSSEALVLARYFMFNQVYFHDVRRIYDRHLQDFLSSWLQGGVFPIDPDEFMGMTDIEVLGGLTQAAKSPTEPGHIHARRILRREHFRLVYEPERADEDAFPSPGQAMADALSEVLGPENVLADQYFEKQGVFDFPVLMEDGTIASSAIVSRVLPGVPRVAVDRVYVEPALVERARVWIDENRQRVLAAAKGEGNDA